jgi:hypothetical protein
LYGAKRQRILTYSRHPNWGLQSKGVAPLFWTQAVNRSETTPALLLVFRKVHLISKDIVILTWHIPLCIW